MNALHCPLLGTYILQESRSFVKVFAEFLTPPDFACPRGKMARLQIAVFPVNAVPIPVGAAISRPARKYIKCHGCWANSYHVSLVRTRPTFLIPSDRTARAADSRPYGMTGVYLFSVYSLKEVKNDRPAHAFPSRGRWHSASPASRMTDEVSPLPPVLR